MICKKCGNSLENNETYCPNCGRSVKKRKISSVIKNIFISVLVIILCVIMLLAGVEIGRTHTETLPEMPDFINIIASGIKELPGIPFDIELTQEKLNEIINKNSEKLQPLSGAKLTISKDKTLILTGTVEKEKIEEFLSGKVPSYLSIFLPQTVSLYVEVDFPKSETEAFEISIKNVTIAGITFSEELTEAIGINKIASDVISNVLASEQSPYYSITKISVDKSKSSDETVLIISGTAKIS